MDYNNYYPAQASYPPPPPPPLQAMGNQMPPMQMMQHGPTMMHSGPPHPPVNGMRQAGPSPGHPSMQQPPLPQASMPQHMQPMTPQPPPHSNNYHQLPPHSASPHPSPLHTPNHLSSLQPPPRPSTGPSPQQPPSLHQSPIPSHNGPPPQQQPPPHMQHQGPPPPPSQLNQVNNGASLPHPPPPMMPPNMVGQPSPQQQPPPPAMPHHPHNQNFIGASPMAPHIGPNYGPPPGQPQPPAPPMHHQPHHPHSLAPQPAPPAYITHGHPAMERISPFNQHIPQTEFRIIELNKRLQNRPRTRGSRSPLPLDGSADESNWWERFASDFFDDDSTLMLRVLLEDKPVDYTIGRTLIPRFFRTYFEGGVTDLAIKLRNTREIAHQPGMIALECDHADITTKNIFKHPASNIAMNVVVHTEGHLSLDFVSNNYDNLLIKSWKFFTHHCHEYIDRSVTTTGLPNAFLTEPVTRSGLTKSTIFYLRMCMIMEPMQDLMLQHRQTKMDPRSCLKHLLYVKYKLKNVEDTRAQPNKRRKRKTPANTGANATTKKGKANANNPNAINNNSNNIGFNYMNNNMMSPSNMGAGMPNLSLASQDVMVVGEPSMLGADFGDENERRITRLENNQFDTTNSTNNNDNNNNGNGNSINLNQSPICNNTSASNLQNPNQLPNCNNGSMNHLQPQQNNLDTGGNNIQMMNHIANNNNNINGLNDSDKISPQNNNNSNPNNNHQMNLITMNGNLNQMNHIVKSEMDQIKQSTRAPPTPNDSEAR